MRRIASLLLTVLGLAISLYAGDAGKSTDMTGWLCNSKCVTCFYWDHLNVNRHLEMSLSDYDRATWAIARVLDRA